MANKVGAPFGNNNATKNKPISEALTKVLHEECTHEGEKISKLYKVVRVWVGSAMDGDRTAARDIVNRIEGTPVQSFEGVGDGAGLVINIRRFTDSDEDDTNVIEHETGEDSPDKES